MASLTAGIDTSADLTGYGEVRGWEWTLICLDRGRVEADEGPWYSWD